jgi:hypothetical protein
MRFTKAGVVTLVAFIALALAACGSSDDSIEIENASSHEPTSATTADRLACTDADEPANFPYFSLGRTVAHEEVSGAFRICHPGATEHLIEPNEVSYFYGSCKPTSGSVDESLCSHPYTITSSPACQLNYSDFRPPRGVRHEHSKFMRWPKGAISVQFYDLGELHIYTGTSTIKVYRGHGGPARGFADVLFSIREEPRRDALGEPVDKAAGPVGINSLPAPVPGAMQGKLSCNA